MLMKFCKKKKKKTISGVSIVNGTVDTVDEYVVLESTLGSNCTDWWLSSINRTSMDFLGDDTAGLNSSFSDKEENPSYFSRDYRLVGTLFQGLILLVGVLGNLLVVMVTFLTKYVGISFPVSIFFFFRCAGGINRSFIERVRCIHQRIATWLVWLPPIVSSSSHPFPMKSSLITSSEANGFGDPSVAPFSFSYRI